MATNGEPRLNHFGVPMRARDGLFALVLVLFVQIPYSHAALILLGNMPQTGDQNFAFVDSGMDDVGTNFNRVQAAISLTMPAQSYAVNYVVLRLRFYNTSAGDVAAVGFYTDNGSDFPGALIGSVLASPPSTSDDVATFNFVPTVPLTLVASTKYWLVLDATAGEYDWRGSAPPITPTSQVGASFGSEIGIVDGDRRDGAAISSFQIIIPEPSSAPVLCAGMLFVACCTVRAKLGT